MVTKIFLSKDSKGIWYSEISRTGSVLTQAVEYTTGISDAAHTLSGLKTGQQILWGKI